jgi:hypothetical protein
MALFVIHLAAVSLDDSAVGFAIGTTRQSKWRRFTRYGTNRQFAAAQR